MKICSAILDGRCKVAGMIAPRRGGCVHSHPHPADGRDADNSAGEIGEPCSTSPAPCPHVEGAVSCVEEGEV